MQQISVFLENTTGSITKMLSQLKSEGIQLYAISIVDTAEYGLCRLLCDNTAKAFDTLKAEGFAVSISRMLAVRMEDRPGAAADIMAKFSEEGINVAYLYSFYFEGSQALAFRTEDQEKAETIIKQNKLLEII